jgi:uncharacterized protein
MFVQFTFNIPGITRGAQAFSMASAAIKVLHLDVGTGLISEKTTGPLLRFSALLGSSRRLADIPFGELSRFLTAMKSERILPDLDGERELIWIKDGIRYRYGFDVKDERITAEWLYYKEKRETYIFSKREDQFEVNSRFDDLAELVRRHLAGPKTFLLGTAVKLFPEGMRDILPHTFMQYRDRSNLSHLLIRQIPEEVLTKLNAFLQNTDPAFKEMTGSPGPPENLTFQWKNQKPKPFSALTLQVREEILILIDLFHALYVQTTFFLDGWWDLFHPQIQKALLIQFNDLRSNPLGSQLVITTLNPYSVNHVHARRDQVWMAHPNQEGFLQLYSLCEFRRSGKIWRKGRFPDYYLQGRTGSVPVIG